MSGDEGDGEEASGAGPGTGPGTGKGAGDPSGAEGAARAGAGAGAPRPASAGTVPSPAPLSALPALPPMPPVGPFEVLCLRCGTVAVSWHRDFPAPPGATIGMAWCACGHIGADAMGFIGYGRILPRGWDPGAGEPPPWRVREDGDGEGWNCREEEDRR